MIFSASDIIKIHSELSANFAIEQGYRDRNSVYSIFENAH